MNESKDDIHTNVQRILAAIPEEVLVVAAAKGRSIEEVRNVVEAGITHVGHNYVQEARQMIDLFGERVAWHMIGHLQRNKVPKAVELFDFIETLDSIRLATALNRHCRMQKRVMPVLIEINSGRESSKTGVLPEDLDDLIANVSRLEAIQVRGLMTMGPRFGDPEHARPYFQATKKAFNRFASMDLPNVSMQYLSMGMSNTYQIAIEEGANIVRIGTKLFGSPRG